MLTVVVVLLIAAFQFFGCAAGPSGRQQAEPGRQQEADTGEASAESEEMTRLALEGIGISLPGSVSAYRMSGDFAGGGELLRFRREDGNMYGSLYISLKNGTGKGPVYDLERFTSLVRDDIAMTFTVGEVDSITLENTASGGRAAGVIYAYDSFVDLVCLTQMMGGRGYALFYYSVGEKLLGKPAPAVQMAESISSAGSAHYRQRNDTASFYSLSGTWSWVEDQPSGFILQSGDLLFGIRNETGRDELRPAPGQETASFTPEGGIVISGISYPAEARWVREDGLVTVLYRIRPESLGRPCILGLQYPESPAAPDPVTVHQDERVLDLFRSDLVFEGLEGGDA
ncbi:MAG: hypothetical protein K9L68_10750 [Spirochaetales bacterium]|nr:hypothetical protein [Spirochaetales bacterium]MCF7939063.1 hypothetical protein [Spirochaetales bacterium]